MGSELGGNVPSVRGITPAFINSRAGSGPRLWPCMAINRPWDIYGDAAPGQGVGVGRKGGGEILR